MTDHASRLRQTRANMLGTDDEKHYWDCHDAAAELDRLNARLAAAYAAKTKAEESELACAAELDEARARLAEAERERDAMAGTLPGVVYMDPPDGGDAPPVEQMRRMAQDAARYRWLRDNAKRTLLLRLPKSYAPDDIDATIDAAMRAADSATGSDGD